MWFLGVKNRFLKMILNKFDHLLKNVHFSGDVRETPKRLAKISLNKFQAFPKRVLENM